MTPAELIVAALAVGAATHGQEAAVQRAYTALRDHLATHYPTLDLTPVEKRPESQPKRASLVEDLGETNAPDDTTLLTLAAHLALAVATHQPQPAAAIAVDLDTVQAELIRLSQIKSSGVGARLKRTRAKRIEVDEVAAGAGDSALRAEFHDSAVGTLAINLQTGGPNPKRLAARYLNWLTASLNQVQLDGIDPQMATEGASRLLLSAVYTALLTKTPELLENTRSPHRGADPANRTRSAVAELDRAAKLVLLGDPGSGKSTFVNFVALCLAGEVRKDKTLNLKLLTTPLPSDDDKADKPAQGKKRPRQPWRHGGLLPVRVILRDFVAAPEFPRLGEVGAASHLESFLQSQLAKAGLGECGGWLADHLKDQGGLVLLDGLDEVPEADSRRVQLKQAVAAFVAAHSRCRFLITGRPYAYQNPAWQLADFAVAELAPFSPGQIRTFIDRWYAQRAALLNDDPAKAQVRASQLQNALLGNPRLYELAERPLLLTLTAGIHAFRQGQLPEGRAELYDEAVTLLLMRWEDRIVQPALGQTSPGAAPVVQESLSAQLGVERSQLLGVLQQLAYDAHASQPTLTGVADIGEAALLLALHKLLRTAGRSDVSNDRLIHYLKNRSGLLIERAPGVYASPHRTFQEFLAACHLERLDFPYQIATLARGDPDRWREVALLTAARARNPFAIWSLAEKLSAPTQPPDRPSAPVWGALLAGQAVAESIAPAARAREPEKLAVLRQQVVTVLTGLALPARERALAGRVLGKLGDPRPEVLTVAAMPFCYVPAGDFYRSDGNELASLPHPYWIGRWPVSNAQFGEFVAAGGYHHARYWAEAQQDRYWTKAGFKGRWDKTVRTAPYGYGEPFTLPNHPVVGITWYEALAFCRWLSEQTEPHGWQVRLPTEREWEKATRGGLRLPVANQSILFAQHAWAVANTGDMVANPLAQRRYPWGEALTGEEANYAATQINTTSALGCFTAGASPYGVEDLSGNVWEWSNDIDEKRSWAPLRGGAYYNDEDDITTSARLDHYPDHWNVHPGLRCVVFPIARG